MSAPHHSEKVIKTAHSSSAAAHSRLAASWRRSVISHGLDPSQSVSPERLSARALKARRDRLAKLLHVASPKLDQLYALLGLSGCGVILTDADGIVLEQRYSDADAPVFNGWGLWLGTDWSEAAEGTNGIGTCLAEDRHVVVHRDEHFHERNIGMSCIDVPIYGADGQLLAALDVSSARVDQTESFNRLIAAHVANTGRQIETSNFIASFENCRIVVVDGADTDTNALLAVDDDDIIVGATRGARRFFDLRDDSLPQSHTLSDLMGHKTTARGFERAERAAVKRALARTNGNVSQAAQALAVSRATLYRRMKRLNLIE